MIDINSLPGIGPWLAPRIMERWPHAEQRNQMLCENPWRLTEISGISFRKADAIALHLGMRPDSAVRARAATLFIINIRAESDGDTCYPRAGVKMMVRDLGVPAANFDHPDIVVLDSFVATKRLYQAEVSIAQKLKAMVEPLPWAGEVDTEGLASDQADAVNMIVHQRTSALLGAAGTGKTSMLGTLLRNIKGAGQTFALAAPTGKAAKRMEEVTGARAQTVHRLLEASYDEETRRTVFRRNESNPLTADWIILDEVSMLDVRLARSLLLAVRPASRLLFVGDPFQLPSVGPGDFLRDITTGAIPYIVLNTLKRQDPNRLLAANCERVRQGQMIEIDNERAADCFFADASSGTEIIKQIVALVAERLPAKYGVTSDEVQVLAALRERGDVSCAALNKALRERLNPNAKQEKDFAPGDRVIQIKNDYRLGVMNGDLGKVVAVRHGDLCVKFDSLGEAIEIPRRQQKLDFAYGLTTHKFQGSQAPWVIIPVHRSNGSLIPRRRFMYTAMSRGVHTIMIGDRAELERIIARPQDSLRWTRLAELLKENGERTRHGHSQHHEHEHEHEHEKA